MSDRPGNPPKPSDKGGAHRSAHADRIESTWPRNGGDEPVSELASEHQGAEAPYGSDVHPPIDLAAYRRSTGRAVAEPDADGTEPSTE